VSGDPQAAVDRRVAARHLVQRPLTCAEHDPDVFRLIRRHEAELDRWFTQRLGYRLHVDADTARLFKSGVVVDHRPLRTGSGRGLHQLEYVLLALVLASTAAGPAIISLRDLVDDVRSAAAEAGIALTGDAGERRALVAVLRWMIDRASPASCTPTSTPTPTTTPPMRCSRCARTASRCCRCQRSWAPTTPRS
jgi:hypothetical protein